MKLTCNRKLLDAALRHAGRAVAGRASLPILNHVLLTAADGRLRTSAYDMSLGASGSLPAEVETPGVRAIRASTLEALVAAFGGETVQIAAREGASIDIECGRSRYVIEGLPAEEYPSLPAIDDKAGTSTPQPPIPPTEFSIPQSLLRSVLDSVLYAASADETRLVLTGMLLERLVDTSVRAVATDSYRLALRASPPGTDTAEPWSAIIPSRAMREVMRMLSEKGEGRVDVRANQTQIEFALPNRSLVSALVEAQFPDYARMMEREVLWTVTADRLVLLAATERATIFAENMASKLVLSADGGTLRVSAAASDLGNAAEELDAEITGKFDETGINGEFLADALKALDSERIEWAFTGPLSPTQMRPVGEGAGSNVAVIMPMQL